MTQAKITAKELSGLSDLMSVEENLTRKCWQYASVCTDPALQDLFRQTAHTHQRHLDELWNQLK